MVPGVVSTFDANGRRNESDIFVRGFGRWQVPLMIDGVRIYLPADNRLDFARFLTADIAEVQIQKGYASVIDGPGAMGGAINLVTRKPTKPFEAEGSVWLGGRGDIEGWNGYVMVGTRQPKYYVQGSVNYSDRDFWTLSDDYQPTANSLQPGGRRLELGQPRLARSTSRPGARRTRTDEYTLNYTKQEGEKGRAAQRLQQSAGAAEQLLALAVLGRAEPGVPVATRSSATTSYRQDQGLLQHLRERSRRVRRQHLHDAVGQRPVPQPLRRPRLWRQRSSSARRRGRPTRSRRRSLPQRRAHRAADSTARPTRR